MISEKHFLDRITHGIIFAEEKYPVKIDTVEVSPKLAEELNLTYHSTLKIYIPDKDDFRKVRIEEVIPKNNEEHYFLLKMKPFKQCIWYFSEEQNRDELYTLGVNGLLRDHRHALKPKVFSREEEMLLKILAKKGN